MYGSNEGAAIGVVHAVQELGIKGKLEGRRLRLRQGPDRRDQQRR